jgi:hypothetical protein
MISNLYAPNYLIKETQTGEAFANGKKLLNMHATLAVAFRQCLLLAISAIHQIPPQLCPSLVRVSSLSASFKHLMISLYIDLVSNGGTAFPIWRLALVLDSVKECDMGKVCRQAASLIV